MAFATADDLNTYYSTHKSPFDIPLASISLLMNECVRGCIDNVDGSVVNGTVKAGIVFNTTTGGVLPSSSLYTLRLNGSDLPSTTAYMNPDDHDVQYQSVGNEEDNLYQSSGYIRLQLAINDAIISLRFNQSTAGTSGGSRPSLLTQQFQRLPVSEYFTDPFHDSLINFGSLYLVIGFYPIVSKLLQNLVLEKERRTREGMKMMGLPASVLNLGWYLTYVAITIIPITFIAIACTAGGVLTQTSGGVIWVMVFLYVQTLLFLSFLLSVFFSSSKSAGQFGGLFIMVLFVPSYAITDSTPAGPIGIACLLSPIAFSQAFKALADAESAKDGLSLYVNTIHISAAVIVVGYLTLYCLSYHAMQ
jgi:hypothetical protein